MRLRVSSVRVACACRVFVARALVLCPHGRFSPSPISHPLSIISYIQGFDLLKAALFHFIKPARATYVVMSEDKLRHVLVQLESKPSRYVTVSLIGNVAAFRAMLVGWLVGW